MDKTKYVLGFAFSLDRQSVALIIKNRPGWQAGKVNGIGGKQRDGEEAHAAMAREFREETGIETARIMWRSYAIMTGDDWICEVFYAITDLSLMVRTVTDEVVVIAAVRNNHLDPALRALPNLSWLVPLALDASRKDGTFDSGPFLVHAFY